TLEDRNRIQVGGRRSAATYARSCKCQLSAGRAVGSVAEEVESQQRMVVEQPVRSAEHRLAIALRIKSQTNARLNVVLVGLNSFLQPELVVRGQSEALRRLEFRRNLHVVAQSVIQSDFGIYAPRILPEESERD